MYAFLTLLHIPHIESLFDLSVRVPAGTPALGVQTVGRSRGVRRGTERDSTQRVLEIV